MKQTLKFMLVLGNAKLVATSENGRDAFYGRSEASHGGRRADLKKLAACLSARI